MKILENKDIRSFFIALTCCLTGFFLLCQVIILFLYRDFSLVFPVLFLIMTGGVWGIFFGYFRRENGLMETAVSQVEAYLAGDTDARIDCDYEGEIYRLFHSVNTLAAVLNAHAAREFQAKEFLKNTISDISHQLKTPLAALNIYNGLIQSEAEEDGAVKEFASLSEKELDRMETLVQNLLKIAKLDAGFLISEKSPENVADMMRDTALHFGFRARQEKKNIILSGAEEISFCCDRSWFMEGIGNIVKNALDHTKEGDTIQISWKQTGAMVRIRIKDDGQGIHPEDMPHIFKRFYRSRFSMDTQGSGLGLSLAKAIVEAHNGTIEVDSELGKGSSFVINLWENL